MNPINGVNLPSNVPIMPGSALGGADPASRSGPSFANFMLESLGEVNAMQQSADKAVEQLVTGGDVNMAEVLTAVQKADMSFRLMMQVRNKLVQAYQEIRDIRI